MTLSPRSLNSPPQRSGIDRDAASSYEVSWRRFRFLQWTTAQKPLINGTVCGSERWRRGRQLHLWVDAQLSSSYNRGCRQRGNKDMREKTKSVWLNRLVLCYLIVGCGCRNRNVPQTPSGASPCSPALGRAPGCPAPPASLLLVCSGSPAAGGPNRPPTGRSDRTRWRAWRYGGPAATHTDTQPGPFTVWTLQPVCLHSEYLHTLIRRSKSEIKT